VIKTSTGFASSSIGIRNTFKLLELLGLGDVDVGKGLVSTAYQDDKFPADCHYARFIPEYTIADTDMLYRVIDDYLPFSPRHPTKTMPLSKDIYKKHVDAGAETVLVLGPFTSLYDFMRAYPESFAKIKHVYAMFGAVNVPGNVFTNPGSPAEFNAMGDPHAAQAVLKADTIKHITIIPLDATNDVPMTPEYMADLKAMTSPEGKFVSELTHRVRDHWWAGTNGFYGWEDDQGHKTAQSEADAYFFWDPLAVAVMANPAIAEMREAQILVVASDPPNATVDGWSKIDAAGRTMQYAAAVSAENAEKVRQDIVNILQRECIENQPLPLAQAIDLALGASLAINAAQSGPAVARLFLIFGVIALVVFRA
jgi:inosine-uridine nucleoside N-ribohydrolase